jgi:condensin complex subunit 1
MDVDGEEDENENQRNGMEDAEDEEQAGGDTESEDDEQMSVDEENDGDATPKKLKTNKLQPRKSQLDVNALNQEQAALAQYDEQALTKIRLQKKFCRDALTFIDEVESAMEPMCKLLGSTNKAEVLEVMEFFRVAHEYQFESAKVDPTTPLSELILNLDVRIGRSEEDAASYLDER